MRFLLDQGLPRSAVNYLAESGHEAIHVSDIGLSTADDDVILEKARAENWVVVTLDSDFHSILALSGASLPSTIRIRIEGLTGPTLANCIKETVRAVESDLNVGAVVSVGEKRIRSRLLPLVRETPKSAE